MMLQTDCRVWIPSVGVLYSCVNVDGTPPIQLVDVVAVEESAPIMLDLVVGWWRPYTIEPWVVVREHDADAFMSDAEKGTLRLYMVQMYGGLVTPPLCNMYLWLPLVESPAVPSAALDALQRLVVTEAEYPDFMAVVCAFDDSMVIGMPEDNVTDVIRRTASTACHIGTDELYVLRRLQAAGVDSAVIRNWCLDIIGGYEQMSRAGSMMADLLPNEVLDNIVQLEMQLLGPDRFFRTESPFWAFLGANKDVLSAYDCVLQWFRETSNNLTWSLFPYGMAEGQVVVPGRPYMKYECVATATAHNVFLSSGDRAEASARVVACASGGADAEYYFHVTTHTKAADYLEYGIYIDDDCQGADFGQGFYLSRSCQEALECTTGIRGMAQSPAVLVFRSARLASAQAGHTCLELEAGGDKHAAILTAKHGHGQHATFARLTDFDCVCGPSSQQRHHGRKQLALKTHRETRIWDAYLDTVVFLSFY